MSNLQLSLIAIGALIILAVVAINWWQERRFHRQVEDSFSPIRQDPLLDEHLNESSNAPLDESLDFAQNAMAIDPALAEMARPSAEASQEDVGSFAPALEVPVAEAPVPDKEFIHVTYSELINATSGKFSDRATHVSDAPLVSQTEMPKTEMPHEEFQAVFEAAMSEQASQPASPVAEPSDRIEPTFEPALDYAQALSTRLPTMLDGQIDATALLLLAAETPFGSLHAALSSLLNSFDKPVFVHVLDANAQWHLLENMPSNQEALNRQISKVACSIQLADRGGAISQNTLNRFKLAVETLGLDMNGLVEWQGASDVLASANALDVFCIEVDKTIGFHLVHGETGTFTGTKLRGLAESQGLTLTADGGFKYVDPSSEPSASPNFAMFNRDDHPFSAEMLRTSVVKGVSFQLDIPHVKQCAEAFNQMVQVAKQMAIGLNAVLVDDNNRALGDAQIEQIRQQLKVIQANMLARGIAPGSDCAHRLFS